MEEVLARAVEHHPGLVMLCSFQKEESVIVDALVRNGGALPRIVTIDTGVLFGETFRAFAARTPAAWWTEQLTPEEVEA